MDAHQDTVETPAQRPQTPKQYYSSDLMRTPQYFFCISPRLRTNRFCRPIFEFCYICQPLFVGLLFRISPRLHTNRLSTRPIFEFCYICQPLFIGFLCCKTSIQDTFRKIFRREILPARSLFPPAYRAKVENPHEPVYSLQITPHSIPPLQNNLHLTVTGNAALVLVYLNDQIRSRSSSSCLELAFRLSHL